MIRVIRDDIGVELAGRRERVTVFCWGGCSRPAFFDRMRIAPICSCYHFASVIGKGDGHLINSITATSPDKTRDDMHDETCIVFIRLVRNDLSILPAGGCETIAGHGWRGCPGPSIAHTVRIISICVSYRFTFTPGKCNDHSLYSYISFGLHTSRDFQPLLTDQEGV